MNLPYKVETQNGTAKLDDLIKNERTVLVFTRHLG
ncbi:hypothetical protein SAMN05216362_10562 [Piscibacillus halophilus]|uniref:Uncharacterized protein n=1 Tax=Piscibacillus halophilus TaxID=571933 RepID=A0A1H9CGJ4_9BACI|nr:hypothetical protein SAMN05216362_10562 [Piscibacillus halophilus]